MRPFGEVQSKAMRAYAQSGQYHTIVESRVRLTVINDEEYKTPGLLESLKGFVKSCFCCGWIPRSSRLL